MRHDGESIKFNEFLLEVLVETKEIEKAHRFSFRALGNGSWT